MAVDNNCKHTVSVDSLGVFDGFGDSSEVPRELKANVEPLLK